ncbi:MAG: cytochrome c biogenesis heme-transporting ATPase CcmA [Gammaproteobacteria bacterium]
MTDPHHDGAPQLAVRDLACQRGDRLLFDALGFDVRGGEALVVEGANGAGKTSLLRILAGFIRPLAGRILWCGREVEPSDAAYRGAVSYIGHAAGLKESLTALENVAIALVLGHTHAGASAADALARVGLGGFEDAPVRQLSAGQRRRVALARLPVAATPIWLLDEPLTALDVAGRETVESLLASHLAAGGIAVLTTHAPVRIDGAVVRRLEIAGD